MEQLEGAFFSAFALQRSYTFQALPGAVKDRVRQTLPPAHLPGAGARIARIVPGVDRQQAKIDEAMEAIRSLRRRSGRIEIDELLSARDEGRRH